MDNTAELIETWFTYHKPTDEQVEQMTKIRNAARVLAHVINENAPGCADRTAALRKVREAVMTANAAIVIPVV